VTGWAKRELDRLPELPAYLRPKDGGTHEGAGDAEPPRGDAVRGVPTPPDPDAYDYEAVRRSLLWE